MRCKHVNWKNTTSIMFCSSLKTHSSLEAIWIHNKRPKCCNVKSNIGTQCHQQRCSETSQKAPVVTDPHYSPPLTPKSLRFNTSQRGNKMGSFFILRSVFNILILLKSWWILRITWLNMIGFLFILFPFWLKCYH